NIMAEGEIDNLTMKQYLTLTQGNQASSVVKPEIGGNVNFKIKSQIMRELREDTFFGNKNDDAHEQVERVWEMYNDLLYKCPTNDINSHQKVNIFYNGMGTMNGQLLDSLGPIPGMTPAQAFTAIQTMGYEESKGERAYYSSGCQLSEGTHLDKECPLNEEVKSAEEVNMESLDDLPLSVMGLNIAWAHLDTTHVLTIGHHLE
ncbi:hypothetical protein Tco_0533431, partial [Tanacetum coccineum]